MALYSLGIDVGRKNDRTAWTIVRRTRVPGVLPKDDDYDVVYASARAGVSSTGIVERSMEILEWFDDNLPSALDRLAVTMDMSGLGWGPAEDLRRELLAAGWRRNPPPRIWAVTITDGHKINPDPEPLNRHLVNIGRSLLTEGTAQALTSGRLAMVDENGAPLPIEGDGADLLREEIKHLSIKTTGRRSRIDHPGGKHDDTWMALCLAYTRAVSSPAPPVTRSDSAPGGAPTRRQVRPTDGGASAAPAGRKPSLIASLDLLRTGVGDGGFTPHERRRRKAMMEAYTARVAAPIQAPVPVDDGRPKERACSAVRFGRPCREIANPDGLCFTHRSTRLS